MGDGLWHCYTHIIHGGLVIIWNQLEPSIYKPWIGTKMYKIYNCLVLCYQRDCGICVYQPVFFSHKPFVCWFWHVCCTISCLAMGQWDQTGISPRCSMYWISSNIYPSKITQMQVNMSYMKHMEFHRSVWWVLMQSFGVSLKIAMQMEGFLI